MPTKEEDSELLILYAGSLAIGVPIREISEIIEPVEASPVPLTCPGFLGLISVRRTIFPLLLLSALLHPEADAAFSRKDAKAVLCSSASGHFALEADAVGDTRSIHCDQVSEYGETSPYFTEKVIIDGREIPLLNLENLAEEISRKNDQIRQHAGLNGND
ncbi:chemotaxis protein CheW [Sporolactobacillus vineae]|uniref:chemotaxis protein CheW n=1 Tax=Sporolactobacillus vineae TaxID=444463 RepID=UPI00028865BB|nr:chemotaxis protein CheW [Sporolactobacillus vineae]